MCQMCRAFPFIDTAIILRMVFLSADRKYVAPPGDYRAAEGRLGHGFEGGAIHGRDIHSDHVIG